MIFRFIIGFLIVFANFDVGSKPIPLPEIAVFEDRSGTLTIDAVADGDPSLFRPLPTGSFSGGFTRSVFWFRIDVARVGETWLTLLPPNLEDLRFFEKSAQQTQRWSERRVGSTLPFSAREVPDRTFVYKLHHADADVRTYYLRMSTTGASVISVRLMEPDEFISNATFEAGVLFASLAIALTVAALSFHTWLWLRDALTPWFIASLVVYSAHLLGISGFLQQYIFPDTPELNFYWICAFSFGYFIAFNGMYRRLFELERDRPLLFWSFELSCWLPLIFLPLGLLGWKTEILPFFIQSTIFMTFVYLALAFQAWRRKAEGGLAMLIAMLISVTGILIFSGLSLGMLQGGFFVWHSLQFTALGSEIALYLMLSRRYRKIDESRIKAEQDAKNERKHRILQGDFIDMLSHELRTSLTVLRMAVDSQPMKPGALAKAQRAMNSMGEVIEHSVKVEQLAEGKVTIEKFPCDVSALIQAVIADSRDPSRIRLILGKPHSMQTDGRLLRIIMTNLVDNALKYGLEGKQIDVELLNSGTERFCIVVSNFAGPAGLPDPQRIFEKYYRAPQAHAFTGSGLGLHIAFALAKLLDADLRYQPDGERVIFAMHL